LVEQLESCLTEYLSLIDL